MSLGAASTDLFFTLSDLLSLHPLPLLAQEAEEDLALVVLHNLTMYEDDVREEVAYSLAAVGTKGAVLDELAAARGVWDDIRYNLVMESPEAAAILYPDGDAPKLEERDHD